MKTLPERVLEDRLHVEKTTKAAYEKAYTAWSSTPPGKPQATAYRRMMTAMKKWAESKNSVERTRKAMSR